MSFTQLLHQAPNHVIEAWHRVPGAPRALFDGLSSEWDTSPLNEKVRLLTLLDHHDLLEVLILEYWRHYNRESPTVLDGFGIAIAAYEEEGLVIRMPMALVGFRNHPALLSALTRCIENSMLDTSDHDWLVREMEKLETAVRAWLDRQ